MYNILMCLFKFIFIKRKILRKNHTAKIATPIITNNLEATVKLINIVTGNNKIPKDLFKMFML
jgi:hypothetical protein